MPEVQIALLEPTKEEIRRNKNRAKWKRYYERHKEQLAVARREPAKLYYQQNRDRIRAKSKKYYNEHREQVVARDKRPEVRRRQQELQRLRQKANPDKFRAKSKRNYENHKKAHYERNRAYIKAFPERRSIWQRRYEMKNKQKISAQNKAWYEKKKALVFGHYGTKCACEKCPERMTQFLCIDHVNNDGAKHRKEIKMLNIYGWLIKNNFPPEFQSLCANCNMGKKIFGTCPHLTQQVLPDYAPSKYAAV